ncbi:hypothetical protein BJ912DRAFT_2521 [Pholiota molesta]|nr:hypothetical protein BJ912DRAFT_2521 [Pholiota molesta]
MNDPKILGYHRRGRFVENELLKRTGVDVQTPAIAFIILFFCHLGAALDTTHLKAVAKRTAGDWPTCPQDLMPFGPESLIESFIIWSRFIPDIMVFNVAAQCIRFCGSLLVPSAVESALTQHVIDAGRQLFDRTWTTIRLRAETRRAAMGRAFTSQVEMLLSYFNLFYDQQYPENKMKMMDGIEVKAVQVFSLLCYVADDPRLFLQSPRILRTRLAQHGLEIYINMERYLDPLPSILLFPGICALNVAKVNNKEIKAIEALSRPSDGPEKDMALTFFDQGNHHLYISMAEMAISHIRAARFDLYCSARNCPNSIQSTGRQFQRCARCNVAVYCGKKCQIEAWSAQEYPHRKICKILQSLVAIAGSELLFLCPRSADPTYYPKIYRRLLSKIGNRRGLRSWNFYRYLDGDHIECYLPFYLRGPSTHRDSQIMKNNLQS